MNKVYFDKENGVWYKFFLCGFDDKPMMGVSISSTENFVSGIVVDSALKSGGYDLAIEHYKEFKNTVK